MSLQLAHIEYSEQRPWFVRLLAALLVPAQCNQTGKLLWSALSIYSASFLMTFLHLGQLVFATRESLAGLALTQCLVSRL